MCSWTSRAWRLRMRYWGYPVCLKGTMCLQYLNLGMLGWWTTPRQHEAPEGKTWAGVGTVAFGLLLVSDAGLWAAAWQCRLLEQCWIMPVGSQTIQWDSILVLFFRDLDETAKLSNIIGGQGNSLSHRLQHTSLTSLHCISGCICFEFAAQF